MEAGTAANSAEERKRRKYAALAEAHQFEPIAVETMGVYGESTGVILRAIGYSYSVRQCVQYSLSR